MKIAIGADHAGFEYKKAIVNHLINSGHEVVDFGTSSNEATDYPDFAVSVAENVSSEKANFGILICGTGIGMSIAANKVKGVRAAVVTSRFTAESSKTHNHANVVTFGSRVNTIEDVLDFLDIYIKTEVSIEERHKVRVEKIGKYEEENE